ncbi:MAG: FHA domain-containing protein, partial [Chloroflexota bacterium]
QDRGVSRVHAQLHYEGGKVFITDLGSTNGTFVSNERLEPKTPTVLRKGDELLLGRLSMQVLFR